MRIRLALLAALPALAACGSSASAQAPRSGLSGHVVEGPLCPVERVPPQPGCAPRPLAATLRIRRADSRRPAIDVRSRSDGRFRVRLAPGTYFVRALPQARSAFPRPPAPLRVQVRSGHFTSITVTYDTGIR